MIVVDTNVIAYLLLPGDRTEAARRLLATDPDWCAPLMWRSELRNVLAMYVRQGHLTVDAACEMQATAESLLEGREFAVLSGDVLALAEQSGRSAYDCEFVALARSLGVRLVTADRQVLTSFPETSLPLDRFAP